ncbi:MAG TPA: response regulator [Rhizobacter sp.]|nr:response regulator [Rhizobacter sp.]
MPNLNILHLEDDTLDADLVRREVAKLTGTPTWLSATSGDDFRQMLENAQIDAILSDNQVPGISGIDALKLARELRPGIPFVFVSGNADPRWAAHCIEAGATDYVPKDQLWRLPGAVGRIHAARESQRLATLTRSRAVLVDTVKALSLATWKPSPTSCAARHASSTWPTAQPS